MAASSKNLNLDCKFEESDLIGAGEYGKVKINEDENQVVETRSNEVETNLQV